MAGGRHGRAGWHSENDGLLEEVARSLFFYICINCHPIQVIILSGNHDQAAWDAIRMRYDTSSFAWGRVPWQGRQESQDALWAYLAQHFYPGAPPLPPMPAVIAEASWQVY